MLLDSERTVRDRVREREHKVTKTGVEKCAQMSLWSHNKKSMSGGNHLMHVVNPVTYIVRGR